MNNKTRGSDQLKLDCSTFSALTQEELSQVAGGISFSTSYYVRPFPQGIPWPELFATIPQFDDLAQFNQQGF